MTSRMKPMSPVDAAWYHIDGPANLAMVTGLLLTKAPLDFERVKRTYHHRLRPFERFQQRVVEAGFPIATPHWQDAVPFDIDRHVHHVGLPAPHDRGALLNLVSDLASTPLDHELPLWQVHVVDGLEGEGALVMRFHHCLGDGTAMMALVDELFDLGPDAPVEREPAPRPAVETGVLERLFSPAFEMVDRSARAVMSVVSEGANVLWHPGAAIEKAGVVVDGVGMLVGELLKARDPDSPFKGEFGPQKRVAWSTPVALDDIKAIGALFDAKVNDVLVAGLTGALRAYLSAQGLDVTGRTLRAIIPVDLRQRERALELGNDFGLVILELALAPSDPLERLRVTKSRMDALKQSPEAAAIRVLFDIVGRGPKLVEDLAVELFGSKASLVLTNVAGPREMLYLAGAPIERVTFFVPHPGRQLGMGVSILSYRGEVTLAVVADAHLVADPGAITEQFNREFVRMLALARKRSRPSCVATTTRQRPCRNRPLAGSKYCRTHQPRARG